MNMQPGATDTQIAIGKAFQNTADVAVGMVMTKVNKAVGGEKPKASEEPNDNGQLIEKDGQKMRVRFKDGAGAE